MKYKSRQEAIKDHKLNYRSKGYEKGKFSPDGPDILRIQRFIDYLPESGYVLDVGCNDGGLGTLLRGRDLVLFGCDVVDELVELSAQKGYISRTCSIEENDYQSDFFDAVIMGECLEHCFNPREALDQITRIIKSDGVFVGSVPHTDGFLGRKHHSGGDYHQQIFETEDLTKLLKQYFHEVEVKAIPYSPKFCTENAINPNLPQWNTWKCLRKR